MIFRWAPSCIGNKVMKHAISFHGAASIDSPTFDHIYAPPAPSVISAAQPAVDTPDMEACSLSLGHSLSSFPLPLSLHLANPSLSPSIAQSGRLSSFLNILKLMYLTQRSALSPAPSAFRLACCLPSSLLLKLIHWMQRGPLNLS